MALSLPILSELNPQNLDAFLFPFSSSYFLDFLDFFELLRVVFLDADFRGFDLTHLLFRPFNSEAGIILMDFLLLRLPLPTWAERFFTPPERELVDFIDFKGTR